MSVFAFYIRFSGISDYYADSMMFSEFLLHVFGG